MNTDLHGWFSQRQLRIHADCADPLSVDRHSLNLLSERVIGACYEVSNSLGGGFLERVYQKALLAEFEIRGIAAVTEAGYPVEYKGVRVGEYFADLVVEGVLLVETKCVEGFRDEHVAQCLNYLKASGLELCLLVNFRRARVEIKRVIKSQNL